MLNTAVLILCVILVQAWPVYSNVEDVEVRITLDVSYSHCSFPNQLHVGIRHGDVSEAFLLKKTTRAPSKPAHQLIRSQQDILLKGINKELVEYRDTTNLTRLDVECYTVDGRAHAQYRVRGQIALSEGKLYNLQPRLDINNEGKYTLHEISTNNPDEADLWINEADRLIDRDAILSERHERDKQDKRLYERQERHREDRRLYERQERHREDRRLYERQERQQQDTRLYERQERHRRETEPEAIYIDVLALIGNSVYQGALSRSAAPTDSEKREETLETLQTNIALLFETVNIRFRSAGSNINIRLVGCVFEQSGDQNTTESEWVQRTREGQGSGSLDGNRMLGAILNYTTTTDNLQSYDVVVAFESLFLYSYDQNRSLEVFARQSSICRPNSQPVVLVRYVHQFTLDAAATTKGLGHALGGREDGDNNNCSSSDHYLMSANSTDVYELNSTNPYYFSTCSVQYFHNYTQLLLGGDQSSRSCLLDALPVYNVTNVTGILPGEMYDPDAQCRLVYGAQSYYCFDTRTLGHKDLCKRLNCYHPPSGSCYFMYGAEGTSCGNKKWCESGECLYSEDAPVTDDVCIHGDQGGRFNFDIMMTYNPYFCYYSNVQVVCCQSCKNYNVTDEYCPYGDNEYAERNCTLTGCNVTSYTESCCETCASFRTTTTLTTEEIPLTTSTTTATTTTIPSTISTSTEKTTHSSTEFFTETSTSTIPSTLRRKTSSNMPTFFSPTSYQSPEPSSTNEVSSGSHVTEEVFLTRTDASVTSEEHPTTEKTNVEENSLLDPTKIGLAVGLAVSVLVTIVVIYILIKVRKTTKSADIHVTEWNNLQHL